MFIYNQLPLIQSFLDNHNIDDWESLQTTDFTSHRKNIQPLCYAPSTYVTICAALCKKIHSECIQITTGKASNSQKASTQYFHNLSGVA